MTNKILARMLRGMLDLHVLRLLNEKPMHGYQIITKIRKSFGVYFGPSTIYPLLATLEKKGFVNSEWVLRRKRPCKIYKLTAEGKAQLKESELDLKLIVQPMLLTAQ